ncbi:MAG: hypothetical protein H6713_35845 [Myxococcales bacterium]|nr:hypothetical protein [Myxococcales bacterium]MCB9755345.1 hypothetical protein [Myxococcales bacterium]
MLHQLLSVIGALLVLGAYAGNLLHRLDRDGAWYAGLNVVGSGLLSYVAWFSAAAGLVLIEVAWALISLVALIQATRRRPREASQES